MLPSFQILQAVATVYDISVEDINGRSRTKDIAEARQIVAYLLRTLNYLSFPAIGEIMGRDHTTSLHAYRNIIQKMNENLAFRNMIIALEEQLISLKERVDIHNANTLSFDEINYNLKQLTEDKNKSEAENRPNYQSIFRAKQKEPETSFDLVDSNKNLEITPRESDLLSKYRRGLTLEEIAATANITRERVRQIVFQAFHKELAQKGREGFKIDIKEYIQSEKEHHRKSRYLADDQRIEIIKKINLGEDIYKLIKEYSLSEDRFLEYFPDQKDRLELINKQKKRWSRFYDFCKECGRNTIPHLGKGICEECLGRVRKRREDLISQNESMCATCGVSREEARQKYGRDLYLSKILDSGTFRPLCKGCFLHATGKILGDSRRNR